jgi:hypothetical protein
VEELVGGDHGPTKLELCVTRAPSPTGTDGPRGRGRRGEEEVLGRAGWHAEEVAADGRGTTRVGRHADELREQVLSMSSSVAPATLGSSLSLRRG